MYPPLIERLPANASARWELVDSLARRWFESEGRGYPESALSTAEARLGIALPDALRTWYLKSAAAHDVWSLQDQLLPPERLELSDNLLLFLAENQWTAEWGVSLEHLDQSDPPVTIVIDGERHTDSRSVSEFALQFLIANMKWSPALAAAANGQATEAALRHIQEAIPQLPFPEWHWPAYPTRLFAASDLVVETDADTWIWIASRQTPLFEELTAELESAGMIWESGGRRDR